MDKIEIYNSFLKLQAEFSFHLEMPLYQNEFWNTSNLVLDLGCGNGYYSKLLYSGNQKKQFYCSDLDGEILDKARENLHGTNCKIIRNIQNAGKTKYDFIILRLVMSYNKDRASLLKWIYENSSNNAAVLIIDANDKNRFIYPDLPNFLNGVTNFEKQIQEEGGERNLFDVLDEEFQNAGFEKFVSRQIIVNSQVLDNKEKFYVFLSLSSIIDFGYPTPSEVQRELLTWLIRSDAYVQYGLFGNLYIKS